MYKLTITRKVYNGHGVFGELTVPSCEGLTQSYTTVEREQVPEDWRKLTPTQRLRYCMPCGAYSVKYMFDGDLKPYFYIQGQSSWKPMFFTGNNEKKANTIRVGTDASPDGSIIGGKEVMADLSDLLQEYMTYGFIPYTPRYGLFVLEIVEADDYHEGDFASDGADAYLQHFDPDV